MTNFSKENYLVSLSKISASEIAGHLAHDLRNRASIIVSNAAYMKHESGKLTDEEQEQFLNSIEQSANDIFTILEAYLEYDKTSHK